MTSITDPYVHAQDLGVTIYFRPLPRWKGLWFQDQKTVILRENMGPEEEHAALSICLSHAFDAGHTPAHPVCTGAP